MHHERIVMKADLYDLFMSNVFRTSPVPPVMGAQEADTESSVCTVGSVWILAEIKRASNQCKARMEIRIWTFALPTAAPQVFPIFYCFFLLHFVSESIAFGYTIG